MSIILTTFALLFLVYITLYIPAHLNTCSVHNPIFLLPQYTLDPVRTLLTTPMYLFFLPSLSLISYLLYSLSLCLLSCPPSFPPCPHPSPFTLSDPPLSVAASRPPYYSPCISPCSIRDAGHPDGRRLQDEQL